MEFLGEIRPSGLLFLSTISNTQTADPGYLCNQCMQALTIAYKRYSRLALVSYSESLRTLIAKVSRIRRLVMTQVK